jgi:hypothetical protein
MFTGLPQSQTEPLPEITDDADLTTLLLEEAVFEHLALVDEIAAERLAIGQLLSTIDELDALHASIEAHGLPAALLQFADTDGKLSLAIPQLPSLESLSADTATADRDAALEGIVQTIKALVLAAAAKIKALAAKVVSAIKLRFHSLNELAKQVTRYIAAVHGRTFDQEAFATLKAKLIGYDQLIELLDIAIGANALGFDLVKLKLPETREEKEAWKQALDAVIATHLGHYSIVHAGKVIVPKTVSALFSSMGYTEHAFDAIAAKLEAYIADATRNDDRLATEVTRSEEDVCQRLDELIERTTSGKVSTTYDDDGRPKSTYDSGSTVVKPEAAKILEHAFDVTYGLMFDIGQVSWVHGARGGLRTLGYLSKAYQ